MSTSPGLIEHLRQTAHDAAWQAGQIIREDYDRPRHIRQKNGPRDLVTDTDHAAQAAALTVIRERYPDHIIVAEEAPVGQPDENGVWPIPEGVVWAVDPLDGTSNFATGLPVFCVSVGAALDGVPVAGAIYDPMRNELFLGAQGRGAMLNGHPLGRLTGHRLIESVVGVDWSHAPGVRQQTVDSVLALSRHCQTIRALGSAALALAYVAAGRLQMYLNYGLWPWDTCAAAVLIREVGGELRCPDGSAWCFGDPRVLAGHPDVLTAALPALPGEMFSAE